LQVRLAPQLTRGGGGGGGGGYGMGGGGSTGSVEGARSSGEEAYTVAKPWTPARRPAPMAPRLTEDDLQ